MAILHELDGERAFPLRGLETVLGRDPSCDIVIRSGHASRHHAKVSRSGSAYYIEDLGSANGTYLNGQRVEQRTRLRSGDRIDLYGPTFTFHEDEDPAAPPEHTLGEENAEAPEKMAILSALDVTVGVRVEVAAEAKLRAILEISKHLGATLDLKRVLPKILESLFGIFPQADRGLILLQDPASGQLVPRAVRQRHGHQEEVLPVSQTLLNHVCATRQAILSADAGSDQRFDLSESIQQLHIRSVMCVPMLSSEGAFLGAVQIDTEKQRSLFRQEDLDVLASATTQAARAVELAQLHQERRDLETATEIQKSFLPSERPSLDQLWFDDYYASAYQIGGDYYDYIPLPGNRLAIALGDVAGKGVSAALLMARLSSAVRFCLASEPSLPSAVRQLNTLLARAGSEGRFVTFVAAVLDLRTFSLALVNAGHLPPLRYRHASGQVVEISATAAGLPLGVLDRPYEEVVLPLEPGDTLLLYTDGVTEARNPGGELYGAERLRAAVQGAGANVEALGKEILASVQQFTAGRPQSDDLTIVCFGRR